jgi:hypothetical protein
MEKRKPIEMAPGLFGEEVPVGKVKTKAHKYEKPKNPLDNPMVQEHGQHPDPALRCKDCNHLYHMDYSRKHWKCVVRDLSFAQELKHRKHWHACNKFEIFDNSINHLIIP